MGTLATIITGCLTGGFSIVGDWFKGKREESKQKLAIQQQATKTNNEIKLQVARGEIDNTSARIKMMNSSWVDEITYFIFYLPLVNMFISPFVDLIMIGQYKEGMLAAASSLALSNLDNAPSWYIIMVITLACLSVGYEKGIEKILGAMNMFKK